jgi:C4-dicarboxylate transporter DctM subunit
MRASSARRQTTRDVSWGLGMPAIILGGIYGGVFTATEAAAVSVIYSAFVCMVIYRQLDLKGLWEVCLDSALASARILIMVAAASLFSWLLTVTGITAAIAEPFAELKQSPNMVLLVANILFLIGGMFIDVFSNILILTPILLGTITSAGIGLVHFGIVTSVNVDIGNITPPFGLNLFVASGTFDKPYLAVVRAVLPWLGLALFSLGIITYFPEVSLWLVQQTYPNVR